MILRLRKIRKTCKEEQRLHDEDKTKTDEDKTKTDEDKTKTDEDKMKRESGRKKNKRKEEHRPTVLLHSVSKVGNLS